MTLALTLGVIALIGWLAALFLFAVECVREAQE